ncbi:MAG: hypothetical protein IJW12_00615, partial [Opitutales bacterium]|nr:hypothetical protein [Opitutales bacterium]
RRERFSPPEFAFLPKGQFPGRYRWCSNSSFLQANDETEITFPRREKKNNRALAVPAGLAFGICCFAINRNLPQANFNLRERAEFGKIYGFILRALNYQKIN